MVVKSVVDCEDDDDEDDDDDDEDDDSFFVVVVVEEVFFVFFQNDPSSFSFDKDFGTHWNATTPNETTTITFTRRGACDQYKRRRLC